jgi:hypothetical protein
VLRQLVAGWQQAEDIVKLVPRWLQKSLVLRGRNNRYDRIKFARISSRNPLNRLEVALLGKKTGSLWHGYCF